MSRVAGGFVVLLEDDMAAAEMYGLGLTAAGYKVAAIPDLPSFFKVLDVMVPHLVVLDWNLPSGTGGEALKTLRGESYGARMPVLILSNFEPGQVGGSALVSELGAISWLVKARTTPAQLAQEVGDAIAANRTPGSPATC